VKIDTTRFGEIEVDDNEVFHLPEGLIGFPDLKQMILLEHSPGSPFRWLQSLDDGEMAFVVVDPLMIVSDYPIDELRAALAVKDKKPKEIGVAVITTVPPAPHPITVNLLAPVGLDPETRTGVQIILNSNDYTTRHILVQADEDQPQTADAK